MISAWAGLAALLALSPAYAGTFTISPLRVDFAGATGMAVLTVRNGEAKPVVVQAQGLAWSQEGGQDALTPSRDLLVSPAVFTLPAGASQLVRVALRRAVDPARELTYRLLLQEVPQAASPEVNGLQIVWVAARGTDGKLSLSARNDGAAHARIQGFAVKTADGAATVLDQPELAYVLPGSTRHWTFDDNNNTRPNAQSTTGPGMAGSYRLEGTTDRGSFVTELQLTD